MGISVHIVLLPKKSFVSVYLYTLCCYLRRALYRYISTHCPTTHTEICYCILVHIVLLAEKNCMAISLHIVLLPKKEMSLILLCEKQNGVVLKERVPG